MAILLEQQPTLDEKARELCDHVVQQPSFSKARRHIEAFLEDSRAQATYRAWQEKGQELHRMSHEGLQPHEEDVQEMERLRQAVLSNDVAAQFVQAEEEMNSIFSTVTKLLQQTLQLGRVPSAAEMADSGCCGGGGGGGCGCH